MNYFHKIQFNLVTPLDKEQVSYCGVDCSKCYKNAECAGCISSGGRPFGDDCVIAQCCKKNTGKSKCYSAYFSQCYIKRAVMREIRKCGIAGLCNYKYIYEAPGFLLNLDCKYPDGSIKKPFVDNKVYISGQYKITGYERRYTVVADNEQYWLIEHDENGSNAVLIANNTYSYEIV